MYIIVINMLNIFDVMLYMLNSNLYIITVYLYIKSSLYIKTIYTVIRREFVNLSQSMDAKNSCSLILEFCDDTPPIEDNSNLVIYTM